MQGQGANPGVFSDFQDVERVAAGLIPAGADFGVTGVSGMARTTASRMRPTSASSRSRAEPAITLQIFLAEASPC